LCGLFRSTCKGVLKEKDKTMMIAIKASYGNEVRRIALDAVAGFAELTHELKKLFGLNESKNVNLKFKDDENEMCIFSNDEEMREALNILVGTRTEDDRVKMVVHVEEADADEAMQEDPGMHLWCGRGGWKGKGKGKDEGMQGDAAMHLWCGRGGWKGKGGKGNGGKGKGKGKGRHHHFHPLHQTPSPTEPDTLEQATQPEQQNCDTEMDGPHVEAEMKDSMEGHRPHHPNHPHWHSEHHHHHHHHHRHHGRHGLEWCGRGGKQTMRFGGCGRGFGKGLGKGMFKAGCHTW